jgi:hypothetical protein
VPRRCSTQPWSRDRGAGCGTVPADLLTAVRAELDAQTPEDLLAGWHATAR